MFVLKYNKQWHVRKRQYNESVFQNTQTRRVSKSLFFSAFQIWQGFLHSRWHLRAIVQFSPNPTLANSHCCSSFRAACWPGDWSVLSGWDKSQPPSPIEVICICFALFGDAAHDSSISTRASGIIGSNLLAFWFCILHFFFLFPFLVSFLSLGSRQGIHAFCVALLSFSYYCGTKRLTTGSVLEAVQHLPVPWHCQLKIRCYRYVTETTTLHKQPRFTDTIWFLVGLPSKNTRIFTDLLEILLKLTANAWHLTSFCTKKCLWSQFSNCHYSCS